MGDRFLNEVRLFDIRTSEETKRTRSHQDVVQLDVHLCKATGGLAGCRSEQLAAMDGESEPDGARRSVGQTLDRLRLLEPCGECKTQRRLNGVDHVAEDIGLSNWAGSRVTDRGVSVFYVATDRGPERV